MEPAPNRRSSAHARPARRDLPVWHSLRVTRATDPAGPILNNKASASAGPLTVLGIDTCGPSGSVALARLTRVACHLSVEILGQTALEGRSYSATLVAAAGDLLKHATLGVRDVGAIVAVRGPGSFTGVRVGLSATKGLAEPSSIPIVAVSRLEVLASITEVSNAALDAHRSEVFLRIADSTGAVSESLAAMTDLQSLSEPASSVAVCEDVAARLLLSAWPAVGLIRVDAPTAADAIRLAAPRVLAGEFADPVLLDGHYLRRSDAEIFGDPTTNRQACA